MSKKKSFKRYNVARDLGDTLHRYAFIYPGEKDEGEYLMLRSRHSEQYREAQAKADRQVSSMLLALNGKEADQALLTDINQMAFAAIVADWSFEEPCIAENVAEFFRNNPFAYDDVNQLAAQDTLFFSKNATD